MIKNWVKAFNAGRKWLARNAARDEGDDCPIRAAARARVAAKHGEDYAKAWSEGVSVESWGPPKYDERGRTIRYERDI